MLLFFACAIVASGGTAIAAQAKDRDALHYIFKPATTILIMAMALTQGDDGPYRNLILMGLALSLLGDIALMLPDDHFLAGLVAFLLAHVAYILAMGGRNMWRLSWPAMLPFLVAGAVVWRLLWPHHVGRMALPAFVYMIAILVMGWQSANLYVFIGGTTTLWALLGAILFLISDSLLALNRFRRQIRHAGVIILGTYYCAQWLIALSTTPR